MARFFLKVWLQSQISGSYPTICENVARAAALCDLEAPGWGSLGFRIVLLLIPGSQISVWHFFPSNASWLSPGRLTRSIACCKKNELTN